MDLPWPREDDTALPFLSEAEFAELFGPGAEAGWEAPALSAETTSAPASLAPPGQGPAGTESAAAREARQRRIVLRRDRAAPATGVQGEAEETSTEWQSRAAGLEKELRSAMLRTAFLTRENSKLTLKLEAAEARALTLERENARLRRARDLALVDGAGI